MSALTATKCIHCGSAALKPDQLGDLACQGCGAYQTPSGNPPKSKDGQVSQMAAPPPDWRTVAQAQLKALLARIESQETAKREAEVIARALAVGGIDVTLPWKPQPSRGQSGSSRPIAKRQFPQCSECGRQFTHPSQYQGSLKDGAVCKSGCAPVAGGE